MRRNNYTIESYNYKLKVFRIGETARIRARNEREEKQFDVAHTHFTYEVFFVTSGVLELITEDGKTVYERSAVIIPPRLGHYSVPSGEGSYCLLFSFERVGTPLEKLLENRLTAIELSDDAVFYIRKASEKLDESTPNAEKDAELLITLLFNEIIGELLPSAHSGSERRSAQRHIGTIEALINSRLKSGISLTEIAAHVYISERQVSRIIAREYGCSLPKLINGKRMAAAEILLKSTDIPISRIAEEVGVSSESYFYTIFKQKYGVSPLKYRKKHSQK